MEVPVQIPSMPGYGQWYLSFNTPRSAVTPPRAGYRSGVVDQRQQILFARDQINDLRGALQDITTTWRHPGSMVPETLMQIPGS